MHTTEPLYHPEINPDNYIFRMKLRFEAYYTDFVAKLSVNLAVYVVTKPHFCFALTQSKN
ncbi:hypothetical protein [Candidatus Nitrosocosmicus sp. SS]|jgi:hypothetical protein|uniref:hypothetical protein n=1 Tax=Candidatus Nitrosocosmicus agrestis TaxID=2563600 RepID=UPI00122E82F9|nr:hypothetical protein [Candidatus Nitrosocosmicus sp. SS]KAA2281586.1 hypothetical protein F1Z66_08015 [Candidatus Nitrosocosmicus sp. SS]KAF0869789.1 hypothetical protein E5N71_03295 [Candidatus Nitrosocosmicus sp. SS]